MIRVTVRPVPIASMLETTKLSIATVAALLNKFVSIAISSCQDQPNARSASSFVLPVASRYVSDALRTLIVLGSVHRSKIPPEVHQTVSAAEECGEVS